MAVEKKDEGKLNLDASSENQHRNAVKKTTK